MISGPRNCRLDPRPIPHRGRITSVIYWIVSTKSDYRRNEMRPSPTEWLKGHAESLGLRGINALALPDRWPLPHQLREALTGRGVSCPPTGELPDKVSPENLELLSKLARVARITPCKRLAEQVIWWHYPCGTTHGMASLSSPALGGRTARGLGVPPPRINLRNREQFESPTEAMVSGRRWLQEIKLVRDSESDLYELFMHISPESDGANPRRYIFDAVAVIRDRKSDPLQIHGIEIAGGFHVNWSGKLEGMAPYFNFLWIAVPEQAERD